MTITSMAPAHVSKSFPFALVRRRITSAAALRMQNDHELRALDSDG